MHPEHDTGATSVPAAQSADRGTGLFGRGRTGPAALRSAQYGEMNRRLFAVPGEITTPAHAGCNRLIADQQASLLSSTSDIEQLCHETHAPSIRP